jgi:hypothetical protein
MLNKKYAFKKTAILLALTAAFASQSAQAANWLMLQGTEKDHQAPRAKVWGFVQAEYQQTDDSRVSTGPNADQPLAFNQIGPQLNSSQTFNIRRARIGIRGANLPLDKNVNYFVMTELGNNGITTGKDGNQGKLTDASITLNHIPGARIRVGLFKTPGSEESFQGIPAFNYINFTSATDRLLVERPVDTSEDAQYRYPVGAVRDTGIQVFDSFRDGAWEHSYAIMIGNGGGLATADKDKDLDTYAYVSTEKVFGKSKGPWRHGMKFYAWMHNGKRTIGTTSISDDTTSGNKRNRSGLGTTYFDGKYRLAAEYIQADGMIFAGTSGAQLVGTKIHRPVAPAKGDTVGLNVQVDEKAAGYHIDLGYRVMPDMELNVRYDALDSGTEVDAHLREFRTTTLGAQYFFNKKTSVRVNYEMRSAEAPKVAATGPGSGVHKILDNMDNRLSAQVMMIF